RRLPVRDIDRQPERRLHHRVCAAGCQGDAADPGRRAIVLDDGYDGWPDDLLDVQLRDRPLDGDGGLASGVGLHLRDDGDLFESVLSWHGRGAAPGIAQRIAVRRVETEQVLSAAPCTWPCSSCFARRDWRERPSCARWLASAPRRFFTPRGS